MDKERLDKILKIVLIFVLIILLVVMRVYKLDSCDLIKDKIGNLNQGQIVSIYYDKCLSDYKVKLNETSYSNISILHI